MYSLQGNITPILLLTHYCKLFEAVAPPLPEFYIPTVYAACVNMAMCERIFI